MRKQAEQKRARLNLSLNLFSPLQREAWDILSAIPAGQRTDAVCHAVCRARERDNLLDAVRLAIREELGGVELTTEKSARAQEAGDVGDDVLGFLRSLQKGDDNI